MKITTANIKKPNYTENHEIYIGTHTGSFKKISVGDKNPHQQTNLQELSTLTKTSKITCLAWGESNDEILIGCPNQFVKIYDCSSKMYTRNVKMIGGPIVGLARHVGHLIAGIGDGHIQIVKEPEKCLLTGDHISHMRQCPLDDKLIATGGRGRGNNIKIWDLEKEQQIFASKNLPNDFLQLEVPIWDSDLRFINANILATCSRYGYIRTYDIRVQRRPVLSYESKTKEEIAYTTLTGHKEMIYVGTATGTARAFDTRKMKTICHTYKGFTGSVSDLCMDPEGKYLFAGSLDRFVRVFNAASTELQYQCYVKSKVTSILMRNATILNDLEEINEEDNSTTVKQKMQKDTEFDEIFANMPEVCEKSFKKRKLVNKKVSTKRKK